MTANDLALTIIKEQEAIVGPLAWKVAQRVTGLRVAGKRVTIARAPQKVLEHLVKQFEKLFGPASREVCRDSVRPFVGKVPAGVLPDILT